MKKLRKAQDKLFKEFTTGKCAQLISEDALAAIAPTVYRHYAKMYRKGFKRCKGMRIEKINNLRI